MVNKNNMCIHETEPKIFRESLNYTEVNTGFTATLIEKDYYCSLILKTIYENDNPLIFKGGTCLSKIYVDFYRLSEDLDFVFSCPLSATRPQRRSIIKPFKTIFKKLPEKIPNLKIKENLIGHNENRQYIGYVQYASSVMEKKEIIKIEISLREPLILPANPKSAKTLAVNPFTNKPLIKEFEVRSISIEEAFAEKFRAALTRKEPAIRDFYDIYFTKQLGILNFDSKEFIKIVKQKIDVPRNFPIDISDSRKEQLNLQLNTQLRPVLRSQDFNKFNLDEAFALIKQLSLKLI